MNPKVWDLWIIDCAELKQEHVIDHIERVVSKGFRVKIVSSKELGAAEHAMLPWYRFQNAGLNGFNIENLYVPKDPEMWEKMERRLSVAATGGKLIVDAMAGLPNAPGRIIYG